MRKTDLSETASTHIEQERSTNGIDIIKSLAVICMIVDHAGLFFWPELTWPRIIGRAVVPLLFFTAGYFHQSRIRGNILWLAIFMSLTSPLLWLKESLLPLDTLASLVAGRLFSRWVTERRALYISIASVAIIPVAIGVISYTAAFVCIPLIGKSKKENWSWETKAKLLCSGFVIYALCQWIGRGYSMETTALLVLWLAAVFSLLGAATFSMKLEKNLSTNVGWKKGYGALLKSVQFMSTKSLEIYFMHVALFSIVAQIIGSK